jgi:hypothetical protein
MYGYIEHLIMEPFYQLMDVSATTAPMDGHPEGSQENQDDAMAGSQENQDDAMTVQMDGNEEEQGQQLVN